MIDFTPCEVNKFKAYGGANGGKINVRYNGESYMLKFPPVPKRNKTMSYTRHNGNWGILVDEHRETAEIAPIYDCGSCLYPQISEEEMRTVINDETEINARIYSFPASAILKNGKKLSYFDFISSLKSEDCTAALKRVCGRLDMERLYQIIEEVPAVPPIQREFYRTMLRERSEKILEYGMKQVLCQEQQLREQDGPRLSM